MLLASALVQAGCSVIFVEGPPKQHRQMPYFACSTSYAPPVVDTVVGGLGAVSALGNAHVEDSVRITSLILAATLGASAAYGYTQVCRCRSASDELAARMFVPPPAPPAPPTVPVAPPLVAPVPPTPAPAGATLPTPAVPQPRAPQP